MFLFNCLTVFFFMFLTDVFYAAYIRFLSNKEALNASIAGTLIYMFSAFVTVRYIEDIRYLPVAMAGAFCGTFITVKIMR